MKGTILVRERTIHHFHKHGEQRPHRRDERRRDEQWRDERRFQHETRDPMQHWEADDNRQMQQKEGYMRSEHEPHHHPEGRRGQGHHDRGPRGERGDRARRGDARYILLDALRAGAKHGYEIIKTLEERSAGRYAPSPGTVYPTLQYLEDEGLVRATQEAERRVYQLTEAGQAELDAHADQVTAFWKRFGATQATAVNQHELRFLEDELDQLSRTIWQGLRTAIQQADQDTIRRVRAAVEQCQNEVRGIISGSP